MRTFKNKFSDTEFKTHYIDSAEDAEKIIPLIPLNAVIGLDIETSKKHTFKDHPKAGLDPYLSDIRLVQLFPSKTQDVYVFDLNYVPIHMLGYLFKNGRFVSHNAVFESQFLTYNGYPDMDIGCSMLMSQLIDGAEHSPYEPTEDEEEEGPDGLNKYRKRSHSLEACVERLFHVRVDKTFQTSDWSAAELSTGQINYGALDAILTYKVASALMPKIKEYKMEKIYRLLKDMQHVVVDMQLTGLPVDWEYHNQLIKKWQEKHAQALIVCKPFFGETNMRSSPQMCKWLENYLKDDPKTLKEWPRTVDKSGKPPDPEKVRPYSFGKTVISAYTHLPAIAALLEYKKYAKLLDTYGESLQEKKHPVTTRLHTSFTLSETRTGRLSSRDPNVQNFGRDREFRNMFRADEGHVLVVSDFSQIELRLQAEFSKDPIMCANYKHKQDIYCRMATEMYRRLITKKDEAERFVGKTVMLALGYGMSYKKLNTYAINAGIKAPLQFWKDAHTTYHDTFSVYSKWCNRIRDRATQLGYIETLFGKRRKLTEDELFTRAPNTVIQGSAAELMMRALLICKKRLGGLGSILVTVHDEILIHCLKQNAEKVKDILVSSMNDAMRELFPNAVSFDVAKTDIAERWGDAKAG